MAYASGRSAATVQEVAARTMATATTVQEACVGIRAFINARLRLEVTVPTFLLAVVSVIVRLRGEEGAVLGERKPLLTRAIPLAAT